MLRFVALGIVLSVVAAACGLIETKTTDTIEAQVSNMSDRKVELYVVAAEGKIPDSAQPTELQPGSMTSATFSVPREGNWAIVLSPIASYTRSDLEPVLAEGCPLSIELEAGGGIKLECAAVP